MSWTNAVITDAGHALQAALLGTGKGLVFTRAVSGAGLASGDLAAQTAMTDARQELALQPAVPLEDAKTRVQVLLSNAELDAGYTMHQLGFYVKAQDSADEILYALVQDEAGDPIPSAAENPGFTADWTYVFAYGNADSVTVTVDPAGTISQEMVGQPGGVASLGPDGKIDPAQLPEMDYASSQHTHSADDITSGTLALARGGTGASNALGARAHLDVARPVRAEVTFPATGWAVAGGAYQQTVSCADASETMRYANIGPKYSPDAAARALEQEAYACIAYVDTADGQLIATCWDGESKPEVNLTLIFEGGAA